jgi:hypothetical protein
MALRDRMVCLNRTLNLTAVEPDAFDAIMDPGNEAKRVQVAAVHFPHIHSLIRS